MSGLAIDGICMQCGSVFVAPTRRKRYCSVKCAQIVRSARNRPRKACVCIRCGKAIDGSRVYFCDKTCRVEHYQARRDELRVERYGMTLTSHRAMLAQQDGRCAICGSRQGGRALAIDHDHGTGSVRALLCISCNAGLGYFRDSPEALRAAALYLEQHANPQQ